VLSDVASGFLAEGKSYRFATLVPQ
jgi:hypothetical protein